MDATLVQLTTPLKPTPLQQAQLEGLATEQRHLRAALLYTSLASPGQFLDLPTAFAASVAGVLPTVLDVRQRQRLRALPGRPEDIADVLQQTGRLKLPQYSVMDTIKRFQREIASLGGREVYPAQLPCPDQEPRIALDDHVIALNAYSLHIDGWDDQLLADLWRLPLDLTPALLRSAQPALSSLDRQVQALEEAAISGSHAALQQLHHLLRVHGPRLQQPVPLLSATRVRPHRSGHATLHRHLTPAGAPGWAVTWSVRLPAGWLPAATVADVVGVDPGMVALITWSDGRTDGQVLRRGTLTDPVLNSEDTTWTELRATSAVQHRQFAWQAAELDAALRTLLTYETVAVEDTNWANMSSDGNTYPLDVMTAAGVTDLASWLRALARATGSTVVRTPAWQSSRHCGECGGPGKRRGRVFTCDRCAQPVDADLNAARYARWWWLNHARQRAA